MKSEKGLSNRYFKTDRVFHEEILGMIEDSIEKNPDYSEEKKHSLIDILYKHFYHASTNDVKTAREEKRIIG